MNDRARSPARFSAAIPAAAALFAHALALRNGFVLDDSTLVTQNPYVRTGAGLKELLVSSLFAAAGDPTRTDYYRPLAGALNWLSWQLFKDGRAGQHGLNLMLHAGVSALLFDVLRKGNVRRDVALVAATLFAVHPATAEIVAYIGGRQDMLGWLFVLGALRIVLTTRHTIALAVASCLALVLGAFSREAFLVIAAVLPMAAAIRPNAESGPTLDRRRAAFAFTGTAVGMGLVAAARHAVGVHWNQPQHAGGLGRWIEGAGGVLFRMLQDLVAPVDLAVDLDTPKLGVPLSLVLCAAFLASFPLAWRALRTSPRLRAIHVFGHLSLFATVAVHTPVALRFEFISDRYAYPFLLGTAITLAPLAERAAVGLGERLQGSPLLRILPKVPWLVVVALLPLTWARVTTWRDEPTLQQDLYLVRPDDPHSKFAEGSRLVAIGEYAKALPLCQAYSDRYPNSARAELCIGMALRHLGRAKEATSHFRRYALDHLGNVDARVAVFDTLFLVGDLDGVAATLDEYEALGPPLAKEPDMIAARKELARRRGQSPKAP